MTAEQIQGIIEAVMAGMSGGGGQRQREEGDGGRGQRGPQIHSNNMKLVQFDGKVSSWDEWSFSFKRHVKQMSGTAYTAMSQTEIQDQPVLEVDNTEEQQRLSADLYDLLCQMTSGEALSVVRSVVDCEGFRAWQVLAKK